MFIIDFFRSIFNKAIAAFKDLFSKAFPIARQIIIGALKDIAINAVTKLNAENLTNEEKRDIAFSEIKDYSVKNGIEARDSLINALLEMAVLYTKEW